MIKRAIATLLLTTAILAPTADAATRPPTDQSASSANAAKVCTVIQTINGKVWKDVYYVSTTGNYHTFLDPSSVPGNNLYKVHRNSLAKWNVKMNKVEFGQTMTGVYDSKGKTMLKIKY